MREQLTEKTLKKKVATKIFHNTGKNNEWTEIYYHSTQIVAFNQEIIILRSGGWRSITTKRRMNEVARVFNLPYRVYQENFNWYVVLHGEFHRSLEFKEGMEINYAVRA